MTELKKQRFSSHFLRSDGIFGSLIILKSTVLIILLDLPVSDSD